MNTSFTIPEPFEPEQVARTLSAYLLGAQAFDIVHEGRLRWPVYGDDKWQLDSSTDFWLSISGHNATLSCRYPAQVTIQNAMAILFLRRYGSL